MNDGDLFDAHCIGGQTLVGFGRADSPSQSGNCFGVFAREISREDFLSGQEIEYKIVNFNVENLRALLYLGLTWPVQCKILSGNIAIIHDARIGERWYTARYCETCCPECLLPVTQIQARERAIMRGDRKEHKGFVEITFPSTEKFP